MFDNVEAELRVKPNLPVLGPRIGKELPAVREALQSGDFEELGDGRFRAAGHELEPDEVLVERGGSDGFAVASADGVTVALELGLDDELLLEGRGYDLIRQVNSLRKEQGLELTDRIVLTLRGSELVERHGDCQGRSAGVEIRLDGDWIEEARCSGNRPRLTAISGCGKDVEARFRFCPWCGAAQRSKLVEFFGRIRTARGGLSASPATSAKIPRCASASGTTALRGQRSPSTRTGAGLPVSDT